MLQEKAVVDLQDKAAFLDPKGNWLHKDLLPPTTSVDYY
jgi:hypothetical protein